MRILSRNCLEARAQPDAARIAYKKSVAKRYNFPITPEFRELLYGSIAADGSLNSGVYTSDYRINLKWESREYLLHFHVPIAEASGYTVNIIERQVPCYNDDNDTISITVLTVNSSVQLKELEKKFYRELTPEEKSLYPDRKRMKILPPNFFITPRLCTYLYLEDGSLLRHHYLKLNGDITTRWRVEIYTYNFELPDVQRLCVLLRRAIGSNGITADSVNPREQHFANGKSIIPKKDVYYFIRFTKKATQKFFDYIGWKSPVACFDYKYPPKFLI